MRFWSSSRNSPKIQNKSKINPKCDSGAHLGIHQKSKQNPNKIRKKSKQNPNSTSPDVLVSFQLNSILVSSSILQCLAGYSFACVQPCRFVSEFATCVTIRKRFHFARSSGYSSKHPLHSFSEESIAVNNKPCVWPSLRPQRVQLSLMIQKSIVCSFSPSVLNVSWEMKTCSGSRLARSVACQLSFVSFRFFVASTSQKHLEQWRMSGVPSADTASLCVVAWSLIMFEGVGSWKWKRRRAGAWHS